MKVLKIASIVIVSLLLLAFVGMKVSGVFPIGLNMHAPIQTDGTFAISGYDPVAYHVIGKATKGNTEITSVYKGVTWSFSSEENKDRFESDPEKYIPVTGGYCLFAAGKGFAADSDPEFWSIEQGKLMLYSDETIKAKCEQNIGETLIGALKNWQ